MASEETVDGKDGDLAQAFRDLAKGERTAAALEAGLSGLERKIDLLLASVESTPDASIKAMDAPSTMGGGASSHNDGHEQEGEPPSEGGRKLWET
ncbi:MAG: hypothetical protein M1838_001566 [Thelocarpon superellum]|nr:MAG: hypothetical protein M1838_001566 [Thelocarpon superellum]